MIAACFKLKGWFTANPTREELSERLPSGQGELEPGQGVTATANHPMARVRRLACVDEGRWLGPWGHVNLIICQRVSHTIAELNAMVLDTLATSLDRLVIYSMYRRLPLSFRSSVDGAPEWQTVLAETSVDEQRTPAYSVLAPGKRPIWLRSLGESLCCHVHVRLHPNPTAPLLIYQHGLSEWPYDRSWHALLGHPLTSAAHHVLIQAPYHSNWREPFAEGFASLQRVYQTLAGSLRMMALVRQQFQAAGAAYSVLAGVSWGGVTSLLYAGEFGDVRAVVPLLASPDVAQVIWDGAELCHTDPDVSRAELDAILDFTPQATAYDMNRVFPLLGESDLFFPPDKHAAAFEREPVVVPRGHVLNPAGMRPLRQHVHDVVVWAANNPLPGE